LAYRAAFFVGLGALALLLAVGAARGTAVRRLPSLYDAADVYARATELEDRGDVHGAMRELAAATFVQPQELSGYQRLGFLHAASGDVDGELATYERAFAGNPLSPRVNMVLGLAYLRRGRLDEAEGRLRLAVSLDARDAMLHAALGDLLVAAKRHHEAIATFERAVALDPNETALHNKAAIAYAYAGQTDRARLSFERALALDPSNAEAADNLRQLQKLMPGATP
jgi:protein O-GlcNAc transferase